MDTFQKMKRLHLVCLRGQFLDWHRFYCILMTGICLKSTIRLYADDALLHYPITNTSSVEAFQKDLNSLKRWARDDTESSRI